MDSHPEEWTTHAHAESTAVTVCSGSKFSANDIDTSTLPYPQSHHAAPTSSSCHAHQLIMPRPPAHHATPTSSSYHTHQLIMPRPPAHHATPTSSSCNANQLIIPHPPAHHATPINSSHPPATMGDLLSLTFLTTLTLGCCLLCFLNNASLSSGSIGGIYYIGHQCGWH